MRLPLIVIIMIIILYSSCKSDSISTMTTYTLEETHDKKIKLLSDLIEIQQVIPIDSSLLFKEVYDLIDTKDAIYISSTGRFPLIKLDYQGNILHSYGRRGNGPGEYTMVNDFTLDAENKIYILDRDLSRITRFHSNGQLDTSWSIPMYAQSIQIQDEYIYYYTGNEISSHTNHRLVSMLQNKVERQWLPINTDYLHFLNFLDFSNFTHNSLNRFYYSFNDTVYHINNKELDVAYYIDFGKDKLTEQDFDPRFNDVMEFMNTLRKTKKAFRIMSLEENDNWISFLFEKEGYNYALINKKDGSTRYFKALVDDVYNEEATIDEEVFFEYRPLFAKGELHYCYVPDELITNQLFRQKYALMDKQSCFVVFKYK